MVPPFFGFDTVFVDRRTLGHLGEIILEIDSQNNAPLKLSFPCMT